jgi:hypothetical protein
MSSNNNLLLLIIAGVIALIVLHITTSNQSCNTPKKRKISNVVVPTGKGGDFKNEKPLDAKFNSAMSQGMSDSASTASVPSVVSKASSLPPNVSMGSNPVSSPSSSSSSSVVSSASSAAPSAVAPAAVMSSASNPKQERFSENFSYTEQSYAPENFENQLSENFENQLSEGFENQLSEGFENQLSEGFQSQMSISDMNQVEPFSANDAKAMSDASTGAKPKPDFVIKSASLGNKFGGGNFNVKLTGNPGAVGPNTSNVNGLGVVEGAPDYTLGVTPVISKEKKAKKLTAKDLLPKSTKDDWFDMPYDNKQMMRIENENLLAGTATQARIGIDTQGQTLKNASHDLRAAPPNPKFNVGPWFISTIEPDYNIKPIM